MSRVRVAFWLPSLLLLGLAVAGSGLANDAPIVLTNEDVEALHSRGPAVEQRDPPARIPPSPAAPALPAEEPARAPGSGYRGPVDSWQDEYYRLKAEALRRALESGDPVQFGDVSETPPAETEAPAPQPRDPACVYGPGGELIYSPRGIACRPRHRSSPNAAARHDAPGR